MAKKAIVVTVQVQVDLAADPRASGTSKSRRVLDEDCETDVAQMAIERFAVAWAVTRYRKAEIDNLKRLQVPIAFEEAP